RCPDKAETSATLVGQPVPGLVTDQSRIIFREPAQPEIKRYRRNGSHDRYLITVNDGIGTRKPAHYPLNGLPGAGRLPGTKPQQQALPADRWSKAITVMTDQQSFEATRPVSADPAVALAEALGQLPKE